ncbi:MAG: hypothetical protein SFW09_18140 [Hyphomicrobiaceae bacterium]|nr:hypothetical protein [Hyphomicrobiaceae bacterium]
MSEVLTVAAWLQRTNGGHLKDDVREMAPLGDGGLLSIQASRYHHCEPQIDSAKHYRSVEIGGEAVLDGPAEPCWQLAPFLLERGSVVLFANVPLEIAERYVAARGGIVPKREQPSLPLRRPMRRSTK